MCEILLKDVSFIIVLYLEIWQLANDIDMEMVPDFRKVWVSTKDFYLEVLAWFTDGRSFLYMILLLNFFWDEIDMMLLYSKKNVFSEKF